MLAEASFNQEKYKEALLRFQKVLERAPDSEWGSWAMLRQGECFENMDQPQNAKIFYVDVVENTLAARQPMKPQSASKS